EKASREAELAARKEELDRQTEALRHRWQNPDLEEVRQKIRLELKGESDQLISQRDAALAEVQKLRAANLELDQQKTDRETALAEVKKLQALNHQLELDKLKHDVTLTEAKKLRDQIKQLEQGKAERDAAGQAEAEKLRSLTKQLDESLAEAKKLQALGQRLD